MYSIYTLKHQESRYKNFNYFLIQEKEEEEKKLHFNKKKNI